MLYYNIRRRGKVVAFDLNPLPRRERDLHSI